jgi:hypothetical protein
MVGQGQTLFISDEEKKFFLALATGAYIKKLMQ